MKWAKGFLLAISCLIGSQAFAVGGDFTLKSDDGTDYSLADSRGKIVVVAFGYTFCPDVCPTALATIGTALNAIGDNAKQVDALFISLDPDRDTPENLKIYTRFFHPQLRGLTGEASTLAEVAKAYKVRYEFVGKGSKEHYTMDHSANLYVIDAVGQLVRILPHGLPPEALAESLRDVVNESRKTIAGEQNSLSLNDGRDS